MAHLSWQLHPFQAPREQKSKSGNARTMLRIEISVFRLRHASGSGTCTYCVSLKRHTDLGTDISQGCPGGKARPNSGSVDQMHLVASNNRLTLGGWLQ
jgi:hypothetical protein